MIAEIGDVLELSLDELLREDRAMLRRIDEDYAKAHFASMLRYMKDNRDFCEMMEPYDTEYDFGAMMEYVEKNGIKVYGFYTTAYKENLLKLFENEEVYSIYTTPH